MPFDYTTIPNGLLRLRVADATLNGDSTVVQTLPDLFGNGAVFSVEETAYQGGQYNGVYNAAGIGGKPAVGAGAYSCAVSSVLTAWNALDNQPLYLAFVIKSSDTGFARSLFTKGGATGLWLMTGQGSDGKFGNYPAGVTSAASVCDGVAHILEYVRVPTGNALEYAETLYVDGGAAGTKTTTIGALSTARLTLLNGNLGYLWGGLFSEMVGYAHAPTLSERAGVVTDLANYYSIAATTPSSLHRTRVYHTTQSMVSDASSFGTGPYTYQWHRSQVAGFSPSSSTLLAGATALTLDDSGLTPGVTYYYCLVATDSLSVSQTSPAFAATTVPFSVETIGVIGDSISAIAAGTGGITPPALMAQWLSKLNGLRQVSVIDLAVVGYTTGNFTPGTLSGLFEADVAEFLAGGVKYVSLMLGANDCGGTSPAQYGANLAAMRDYLSARGMVLIPHYPMFRVSATSGSTQETNLLGYQGQIDALVNGISVLAGSRDTYDYFKSNPSELGDGLHPNATGVESLAALWLGPIYEHLFAPKRAVVNSGSTTLPTTIANTGLSPGDTFAYSVQAGDETTIVGGLSGTVLSSGEVRIPSLTLPDGSPAAVWLAQIGGVGAVETLQIAPVVGTDGKALLSSDAGNTAQLPDAPAGYGGGGLTTGQDATLTAVGAVLAGFGTAGQPGGIARAEDVRVTIGESN